MKHLYGKRGRLSKEGRKVSKKVSSLLKDLFSKDYDTRTLSLLISEEAIFLASEVRRDARKGK